MKTSLLVVSLAAVFSLSVAPRVLAGEGAPAAVKPTAKPKAKSPPAGEVTLKGQLTCAKCGLHESSVCQNVLRVPDAGDRTETKYYLTKNDIAQAHHEEVCGAQVNATITGRVTEEGGKKILTASSITVN